MKVNKPIDWLHSIQMGVLFYLIKQLWGCLIGPPLTGWYKILGRKFDIKHHKSHIFGKVLADQLIWAPVNLLTFLIYTVLIKNIHNIEGVKLKIKSEYLNLMKTNYIIWPIAQLFNFAIVPIEISF